MGKWNTHGMEGNIAAALDAASVLGMNADEMEHLADYWADKADLFTALHARNTGQDKRKCGMIAKHCRLRAIRWRELSAKEELVQAEFEQAR